MNRMKAFFAILAICGVVGIQATSSATLSVNNLTGKPVQMSVFPARKGATYPTFFPLADLSMVVQRGNNFDYHTETTDTFFVVVNLTGADCDNYPPALFTLPSGRYVLKYNKLGALAVEPLLESKKLLSRL